MQSLMLSGDKACFLVVFWFVFTVSSYPGNYGLYDVFAAKVSVEFYFSAWTQIITHIFE